MARLKASVTAAGMVPPLSLDEVRWVASGEMTSEALQRVVRHNLTGAPGRVA